MNIDLLKYILKNEAVQIDKALNMSPSELAKELLTFIGKLDRHEVLEETTQALGDAVLIAQDNKDGLLLWMAVLAINGILSIGALEVLTEISFSLLHEDLPTIPALSDIDEDSVFYSFSNKVLPELLERVAAAPTLFCFREHCKLPKKLKSMLNLCCVAGELTTFPDFDRYSMEIEVAQEYTADICLGLQALAQLAYITALLYITKGESKLGAVLAMWAKAQVSYKQVYKNIYTTLGIVDVDPGAYLH